MAWIQIHEDRSYATFAMNVPGGVLIRINLRERGIRDGDLRRVPITPTYVSGLEVDSFKKRLRKRAKPAGTRTEGEIRKLIEESEEKTGLSREAAYYNTGVVAAFEWILEEEEAEYPKW